MIKLARERTFTTSSWRFELARFRLHSATDVSFPIPDSFIVMVIFLAILLLRLFRVVHLIWIWIEFESVPDSAITATFFHWSESHIPEWYTAGDDALDDSV